MWADGSKISYNILTKNENEKYTDNDAESRNFIKDIFCYKDKAYSMLKCSKNY